MSKSFEVTNRNLAILYIVANDHAPAKDMNHSPEASYEQSAIHYIKHLMS